MFPRPSLLNDGVFENLKDVPYIAPQLEKTTFKILGYYPTVKIREESFWKSFLVVTFVYFI